jgi:hypothetical protein
VVHVGVGLEDLANTVDVVGFEVVGAEDSVDVAVVGLGHFRQACGSKGRS